MLSFPASDPPAVFVEEPGSRRKDDADPRDNNSVPAVNGARSDRSQELR
jgi:hypothetical protein